MYRTHATTEHAVWRLANGRTLALDRPRVIAIINTTPDSFFEASRAPGIGEALAMANAAFGSGADMLDIGGESTRPGAERISARVQIDRIAPILRALRSAPGPLADIPVSIDTTLAEVAEAALDAGADAINDVSAGEESAGAMLGLAASRGAGLILMHRLAPPERDRYADRYDEPPEYADVVESVASHLGQRSGEAERVGVPRESIVIDPGLGFGKSVEQNLELVRRTPELLALGYPVLSAASRKSFVGRVSLPDAAQTDPVDRLAGSLAFSVEHLARGARLFRVHDPSPHRQALAAAWAIGAGRGRAD